MRTAYAVILSVLLVLVTACAPKVNDPADVQAIKKSMDDFAKAVNARDANAVAALMTDKTVFSHLNAPVVVGKEAIQEMGQAFFDQYDFQFGVEVADVQVAGDLGVARGTATRKWIPKAEGLASLDVSGNWTAVLKRQGDGAWKWDSIIGNSDLPTPGNTASGEDEQALYQIERDMGKALLKKDAAAWDRMLANEFQGNYATFIGNKKQFLAVIKSDTTKFESAINSEMKALVFGDRAIVHGLSTSKSSMGGKDTSGQERYTEVFVKRDGRWQCVTGYSTKVQ